VSLHYVILCHRSSNLLPDLFRAIYDRHDSYAIHVDSKAPQKLALLAQNLAHNFPNAGLLESRSCSWAGYSLVALTIDAVRTALIARSDWTHMVLLSEQHLPLLPARDIAAHFEAEVSYVEAHAVSAMNSLGQADVLHRFARRHRELEGVGSFPLERQSIDPAWLQQLQHGSQWVVLSRGACQYLLESLSDRRLWEPFEGALLADETAIPTIMMRGARQYSFDVRTVNSTFVAYPSAGGHQDLTFSERNFFEAKERGFVFIRKRPDILPESVRQIWQQNCNLDMCTDSLLESCGDVGPSVTSQAPSSIQPWTQRLVNLLRAQFPQLNAEQITGVENAPPLYLQLRQPHWPRSLSVCLLSERLRQLKILILWQDPFDGSYEELRVADWDSVVLKTRVYGLFGHREIVLGTKVDYGFVELAESPDAAHVAFRAGQHIVAAEDIARSLRV
jgi:hypothetical protein